MQSMRVIVVVMLLVPGLSAMAGDPGRGQALSAVCAACHGPDGMATIAGYPHLAAQNQRYTATQLALIRDQERVVPEMAGMLQGMSDQDLADLGAYYETLPMRIGHADPDEEQLEHGERIYRAGIANKGVVACAGCHSPTGAGNGPAGFPRLAGQAMQYTVAQLRAYRERERETDEEFGGMMRDVAHGLTDYEIRAVANYIQGLHWE